VCLWVGVFTDAIIRSYINSAKHNDTAVLEQSITAISTTPCQWKLLDIRPHS